MRAKILLRHFIFFFKERNAWTEKEADWTAAEEEDDRDKGTILLNIFLYATALILEKRQTFLQDC